MRRVAIIVALAGLVGAAACASLSGLSGGEAQKPVDDAGADVQSPQDAAPPDPCAHATYPAKPATDDDPAGSSTSLVLALKEINLRGAIDGGAPVGYDLDGVCTCFPDPATAHAGASSCVPSDGGTPSCDADGGVDAVLGNLVAAYPGFFAASAQGGGADVMIKITNYNGRANDREVFVGIVGSNGIYDDTGCSIGPDAGKPPFSPTWRGCDLWTVDPAYVLPGTSEPANYLPAYVVDHVLVVPPAPKAVPFQLGSTAIPIGGVLLTGRLVALDAQLAPVVPQPAKGTLFRLEDGVIAGRVSTSDSLLALAVTQAQKDGGPLCGSPNLFTAIKEQFVCPNADVATQASLDFTNAACGAVSVAAGFIAEPALLGPARKTVPGNCADPRSAQFKALFDCNP